MGSNQTGTSMYRTSDHRCWRYHGWFLYSDRGSGGSGSLFPDFVGICIPDRWLERALEIDYRQRDHSGTVMLIVGGCYLFGWVISNERWAVSVTNMLVGLHTSLAVKLLLVNLVLLVVGMFMDSAPAIMLVAPILAPAMASLALTQFRLV